MGCIKFIVKQDEKNYQIKIDNGVLFILDENGKEINIDSFKDIEKNIIKDIKESISDISNKFKNENNFDNNELLYNYFFNVLNDVLKSKDINRKEENNGDITYTINGSFGDIQKVFDSIKDSLKDIKNVNEDILRHYTASYRENILGHKVAEDTFDSNMQEDILYALNNAVNKAFGIGEEDITKKNFEVETKLKAVQQELNNSITNFLAVLNKLTKTGGLFNTQLYDSVFQLNENLNYVQTLRALKDNYEIFANAFNTNVSRPYDILANTVVELPIKEKVNNEVEEKEEDDENEEKEEKKPKGVTIKNLIRNIYSSVDRIEDDNVDYYEESINKLIEEFNKLEIENLLKSVYGLHEHINLVENLYNLLKSDLDEKDKYLDNVEKKGLEYVEGTKMPIKILENIIFNQKVDNKSLEILNLLSKLYVDIMSLKTTYEYFKMNKIDKDTNFTSKELQKIIELSNIKRINKDITKFNEYLIQFESTNVAELTSLKILFDLHDIKLKRKNDSDLKDIKEKYNDFKDKFGGYEAMENAMNYLFERDKTKTVRTGYLISKYDNSKLVEKDDAFRTSNMNGDLYELYKFIRENTTYDSLIDNINIVPSIFDLLGFEYKDNSTAENNFKKRDAENNFKKRDDVYNHVVFKYSNIRTEGKSNEVIGNNSFDDKLRLKNNDTQLKDYLENIKNKLYDYIKRLEKIKDSNGNRVINDEYIEFMRIMVDHNHKKLKNYFQKYRDENNEINIELNSLTYNDIATIANSYMTILDRYDIGTYFMYMNDVYNSIDKRLQDINKDNELDENRKKLEEDKVKLEKSDFGKIYKLSQSLKFNNLNYKENNKILSEDYKEYLEKNSNIDKNVLDEFYDYFYETFLKLNNDVDNIDMYSRIGNRVFVGEAEKTTDEKVEDNGIWETYKDEVLSELVNEKAVITYKIFDDDSTMIRNMRPKSTSELTEDKITKNLFINLINSTMDRNRYEMADELIMNGKSYIMSLRNNAIISGTNIKTLNNLLEKIKNEIEAKLGFNIRRLFMNEVPVLKQSGIEKIERKLTSEEGQLLNSNINKFYETMTNDVINEFYDNRLSIYNKLMERQVDIKIERKSKEKVTHIEFSEFLRNVYTEIMNNPVLMNNVVDHNKVLNGIILHTIANNENWLKQLRAAFYKISNFELERKKYLNGKSTKNMDDNEFLYFITNEVKTLDFILIYVALVGRSDIYNEKDLFNDPLKKFTWQEEGTYYKDIYDNLSPRAKIILKKTEDIDTEALIDIKDVKNRQLKEEFKRIEAENQQLNPGEKDKKVQYNLYTTPITIDDLERMLQTMFKVNNTDVVQTKKLIEQEVNRTEKETKVFSIDRTVNTVTSQTASAVLTWNLATFVAELAYSTIGFFNLGLSSNNFSLPQVLKAMFRSYSYTMKSSMYADKKIEKIKQILNSGEMINKIGYDHPYYKDMEFNNNVDVWLKRYKDFKNVAGHVPSSIHKNTALYLACENVYVDIVENGQKKRVNILDCFDDNGDMIYPVNDYVISKLMSVYTEVLKQNTLYNNGNVELNKTVYRHLALFKTFLFNMMDNYFHNDTYSRAFGEYHRGIYQSLFGKGSLFINNEGRFNIFRTISLIPSVITGDASELKYKSDINNIKRFGLHILTLVAIYLAIQTLADDIYEDEEYGFYDEDGNYVKGKRRKRLKGADKTQKYLYSLLSRIYRENMLMYDANSTVSLFSDLGLPQVGYITNMYEFVAHTLSGDVYTTGVYKGQSKAKIDFMQMTPYMRAILQVQTLGNQSNLRY